jgi:hypothetical protein
MAARSLLDELRDYFVAQGIARIPRVAGAAPPMWLDPRHGVPAPGEGDNATEKGTDAVLGAYLNPGGGVPAQPYESWLRGDIVEIRYRTTTGPRAFELERQVRAALVDKRDWQMAGVRVIESEEWLALARLDSDDQAFTYRSAYVFQLYAA